MEKEKQYSGQAVPVLIAACKQLISQLAPVAVDDFERAAIEDGIAAIEEAEKSVIH